MNTINKTPEQKVIDIVNYCRGKNLTDDDDYYNLIIGRIVDLIGVDKYFDKFDQGMKPEEMTPESKVMKPEEMTPESKVMKLLLDMQGIGGIPSEEDFADEFMFRFKLAFDIPITDTVINLDADEDQLQVMKKEYAQGVPEFTDKEEPFFIEVDEQIIQVETIVTNEMNEVIEVEGYMNTNEERVVEAETLHATKETMITKLKNMLFGKTSPTLPLIQCHAIANFNFAEHNFDRKGLISAALEGEHPDTIKHIEDMFRFSARKSLVELLPMLSEDLQGKIIMYVMNNYQGVKPDTVDRYYLKT